MGSPGSLACLAAGRDTAGKHHSENKVNMGEMDVVSYAFKQLIVLKLELLLTAESLAWFWGKITW